MLIDGLLIISINLVYAANETGRVEGYAGPSVVCDCLPESVLLTIDTSQSHFKSTATNPVAIFNMLAFSSVLHSP